MTTAASSDEPADLKRQRLAELLGADRWVSGPFPTVAPVSTAEVSQLLAGTTGRLLVVGSGSNFPPDYTPPPGATVLLTSRLRETLEWSIADQTVTVSAGWLEAELNERLRTVDGAVPVLLRQAAGTVGGALASTRALGFRSGAMGWSGALLAATLVLPDGKVLRLGSSCLKDVAGYDLKQLLPGCRGCFGVITELTLRLRPLASLHPNLQVSEIPLRGRPEVSPAWAKIFDPQGRMAPGA